MLFSQNLQEQIISFFSQYKDQVTKQDSFELDSKSFPGLQIVFGRQPKTLLFPLGKIEDVAVYLGSDKEQGSLN